MSMSIELMILLRTIVLFFVTLILTRILGRGSMSNTTPFNFISYVVIAIIVSLMSLNIVTNFFLGMITLLIWTLFSITLDYASMKSKWVHDMVNGKERILIKDGKVMEESLSKVRFTGEELLKELRSKSVFDLADVEFAIMETTGDIKVGSLGNFEASNMVNNFVTFENGTIGRICSGKKDSDIEDLFIDLGVKGREEALKLVKEGNVAKFNGAILEIGDNIVAPYMDNRVGLYILLKVLKEICEKAKENKNYIKTLDKEYYFVFSTQNKLGARGARAATYNINPDCAIVIDVEGAFDYPGGKGNISLGNGPIIKVMDRTLIVHHEIKDMLEKAATKADIKTQYSVGEESTDGATIHKEGSGVKTGVLSVPCRYIHTNEEMINLKDLNNSIKLVLELI